MSTTPPDELQHGVRDQSSGAEVSAGENSNPLISLPVCDHPLCGEYLHVAGWLRLRRGEKFRGCEGADGQDGYEFSVNATQSFGADDEVRVRLWRFSADLPELVADWEKVKDATHVAVVGHMTVETVPARKGGAGVILHIEISSWAPTEPPDAEYMTKLHTR